MKKALLIGINYRNTDAELNGCINDIKNIREILINNCDYPRENIKVLTEDETELPIRSNIEMYMNWLVLDCKPGDTLVLYYSGHGSYIEDESKDESDGKDEVMIPLDYEKTGIITDDWIFNNVLNRIPVGVKMWGFMDCCHSGTLLDLKYNYKSLCKYTRGEVIKGMPYVPKHWSNRFTLSIEKPKSINGSICMLSGCQDQEVSMDAYINQVYQGAFSYCLIEILKNNMTKDSNGKTIFVNGKLKLRNILKEINSRLDINGFGGQNSQLSVNNMSDFEITLDL